MPYTLSLVGVKPQPEPKKVGLQAVRRAFLEIKNPDRVSYQGFLI
jgi:hypothetical protein